jgi:thiamine kinase-like enzyme
MNYEKVIAVRTNKTIYKDGDRIIKVFNQSYSKSDCLNEALNQARIEETKLDIPKILEVTILEDKIAIVSEYIKGKTLQQIIDKDPKHLSTYLKQMVALQMEVHEKTSHLLSRLPDKLSRKINHLEIDPIVKYELLTRLDSMPRGINQVLHGDFNPSNIIITPTNKAYILDWAHATQGHPYADIATTYLLFYLDGKEDVASEYLDIYCQTTKTSKGEIQRWLPIVAASRLSLGIKNEKEILSKWINVVEY